MNKYKRIGLFATAGVVLTAVLAFVGETIITRRRKRKDREEELNLLDQEKLAKRQRLEKKGWKFGSVDEFLDDISGDMVTDIDKEFEEIE